MLQEKNNTQGIDFIIVVFYRFGYAQILTESIKKYVKNIPYTINIVNNGINTGENSGLETLKNMFKDEPNVNIIAGIEQTIDSNNLEPNTYECKHDGRKVSIGSYAKAEGMKKALLNSNREYVCYLDADTVFLGEWTDEVLSLLEENVFVSHKWREDIQMDGNNFCIVKREVLDNNHLYEEHDLYPNLHWKDSNGMLSHWANTEELPYVILTNSHNNRSLKSQHTLNFSNGEQAWIDNRPVFFHHGRGSVRADKLYKEWIEITSNYLGLKIEDITL